MEFTEMHFEEARDLFRAGHLDIREVSGITDDN